ncbi:MAG: lipase family protein [Bradymonadaceae bacterium]
MNVQRQSAVAAVVLLVAVATSCRGAPAPSDAGATGRDGGDTQPVGDARGERDAETAGRDVAEAGDAADPSCRSNGCLIGWKHLGTFSERQIEPLLDDGVSIDNGYAVFEMRYMTDGREALATVTVPSGDQRPSGGYHVVANNHGTTGLNDRCALAGEPTGVGLAGLFGARGAIGVAPDYPGLGTPGWHPYLVARVEARAALDALRATSNLAERLEVPVSGRYAMVGLSQGGHATLAAAAAQPDYAPELDVRAFAAAAPPSVWESHWRASVGTSGPHQVFQAMLVFAWARHYGWSGPGLWTPDFRSRVDSIMRETCVFEPRSFENTMLPRIGRKPDAIFSEAFLSAYRSGDWGPYAAFDRWFERNRLDVFSQQAPVRIYQGSADQTVPRETTDELVDELKEGEVDIQYRVVQGGTHTDVAFGPVAQKQRRTEESVTWVLDRLASP